MTATASLRLLTIAALAEERGLARQMLKEIPRCAYEFSEASTGKSGLEAIARMGQEPPDCLLLASDLPDMDAIELLCLLTKESQLPPCPVVVLSEEIETGQRSIRAGAQDYLVKSRASPQGIFRAIENAMERYDLSRQLKNREDALRASQQRLSEILDASGLVAGEKSHEITETTRDEETQRQNVTLFSTLISQAPMGTYVVDAQFCILQVNAEAMPTFATIQPLIGRDLREVLRILWGEEVGGECAEIFQNTLDTGKRYISPPFTRLRQDLGIEQTYEWETQRLILPNGEPGVVCYFHEVTERARALAALRASQERIRLAAEATGVGMWEWNISLNKVRWDPHMFRLYGLPQTEDGFVRYETWSHAVVPGNLERTEERN